MPVQSAHVRLSLQRGVHGDSDVLPHDAETHHESPDQRPTDGGLADVLFWVAGMHQLLHEQLLLLSVRHPVAPNVAHGMRVWPSAGVPDDALPREEPDDGSRAGLCFHGSNALAFVRIGHLSGPDQGRLHGDEPML